MLFTDISLSSSSELWGAIMGSTQIMNHLLGDDNASKTVVTWTAPG